MINFTRGETPTFYPRSQSVYVFNKKSSQAYDTQSTDQVVYVPNTSLACLVWRIIIYKWFSDCSFKWLHATLKFSSTMITSQ